ncbi:Protein-glutamate methylesterase/protein-glutamine glutaminase [subsurface metagenome]
MEKIAIMKSSNEKSKSNNKENIESKVEKIRVLHVDDEEGFLELTKIYLEKISDQKLHVDSISSSEQVVDYLKDHEYDVLVSDYQMPGLDGLELLKKLRNQDNDIPFIIFTGKGREEIAIQALNLGADSYVKKGVDSRSLYTELAHIIERLVKEKNLERKLYESQQSIKNAKKKIFILSLLQFVKLIN